jgi:hypothetical protein
MGEDAQIRDLKRDAERYRQAAQDALEQLDWCIGYLHGSRKASIAAALGRNRAQIRRQLMHLPEESTPSDGAGRSRRAG